MSFLPVLLLSPLLYILSSTVSSLSFCSLFAFFTSSFSWIDLQWNLFVFCLLWEFWKHLYLRLNHALLAHSSAGPLTTDVDMKFPSLHPNNSPLKPISADYIQFSSWEWKQALAVLILAIVLAHFDQFLESVCGEAFLKFGTFFQCLLCLFAVLRRWHMIHVYKHFFILVVLTKRLFDQ